MMRRGKLASDLRAAVDAAIAGELVGPIAVGQRWCLFRVGARMPAVLDDDLKRALQRSLFQQWLAAKVKPLTIQLAHQNGVRQDELMPAIAHS